MPKFTLTSLTDPSHSIEFEKETITVGRAKDNDFVIQDCAVSRYQADIKRQTDGWRLINVGRFPVRVNKIPTEECFLSCGDILTLGNEQYQFQLLPGSQPENAEATVIQDTQPTNTGPQDCLEDISDDLNSTVIFERPWLADNNPELFVKQRPTNILSKATAASAIAEDNGEETIVEAMPAILNELKGTNPGASYSLEKPEFIIGRSADSDLFVDDKRVSRRHFSIEKRVSGYYLVRLTKHQTVLVNHQPVDESRLYNNDQIDFFTLSYQFKSTNPADQPPPTAANRFNTHSADLTSFPDPTFLKSKVVARKPGPRLINHNKHGHSTVYHLNPGRTCIGRDQSNDIIIEGDKSISRLHAVIEKQSKGHFINAESENPLLLNGKRIRQSTRIFSGDSLQMGETLLTFLSEFKDDTSTSKKWTSGILLALASVASMAFIGILVYFFLWQPWHFKNQYEIAQQHLANTAYDDGREILQALYVEYPGESERKQVTAMLADTAVKMVNADIHEEKLEQSKAFLADFLQKYGNTGNLKKVWEKINEVRFLLAKKYESDNQLEAALKEYVAIDINSAFYNSAQKAISNLWLRSQQNNLGANNQDTLLVDVLLQQANVLFEKKHYLTPRTNNAYAKYAKILAHDPNNTIALTKIEQIKNFYLVAGNQSCLRGDRVRAETYRRRYLIIDPENKDMQQALNRVDQCVGPNVIANTTRSGNDQSAGTLASQPRNPKLIAGQPGTNAISTNQESRQNVEELLKKEGVESQWIIEYLFDEPDGKPEQTNRETPW